MIIKNLKINRFLTLSVIIIISFVYTVNIQPAVFGSVTNFFQIDDSNNIINVVSPRLYGELSSFYKNFPSSIYYNDTLPNMILKTNKEIRNEFFTYFYNDNTGFVLQLSYFFNSLENKSKCMVRI